MTVCFSPNTGNDLSQCCVFTFHQMIKIILVPLGFEFLLEILIKCAKLINLKKNKAIKVYKIAYFIVKNIHYNF